MKRNKTEVEINKIKMTERIRQRSSKTKIGSFKGNTG